MAENRYFASMIGGALGDAMGRPTEFIRRANAGLDEIDLPVPALITDDTQMAIAVGFALEDIARDSDLEPGVAFTRCFLEWMDHDDLAGRAPGNTCLTALHAARRTPLRVVAQNNSKGCGTVMRAHPVAFLDDTARRRELSVAQAIATHGHPTSTVSTVVWTELIAAASREHGPETWLGIARESASAARADAPELQLGYDEVTSILDRVERAVEQWDIRKDPCDLTGEGWIAEEAMATSLLVAIRYADQPTEAIRRAARTRGDSDSIASMVGALLGAYVGIAAWPDAWVEAGEEPYLSRIRELCGLAE